MEKVLQNPLFPRQPTNIANWNIKLAVGKQRLGSMNGNGKRFADVCADYNLAGQSLPINSSTQISPDNITEKS